MDEFLMMPILNELENENAVDVIRQKGNPIVELNEQQFVRLFRVTKVLFYFIVELLTPFLKTQYHLSDLDVPTRVLAALRFYSGGSYQHDVGCNWFIGISQSSVSRSINEVTEAFNNAEILNRFVRFPRNLQELNNSRRRFYEKFGFPGMVGCIDCTHVAIFPPSGNADMPEHLFVNRKNYHSINVQLICDEKLKIIDVVAKYPGSTHDAFIWRNSAVNALMQNIHQSGHTEYFLLGDLGYPLRPWLLTPMEQEPALHTPAHRYNTAHKNVRSIIERCNGLLKARFRCCLKHRILHYAPDIACRIINACVILHNMCIEHNIPEPEQEVEDAENGIFGEANAGEVVEQVNPGVAAGRNFRVRLINARF